MSFSCVLLIISYSYHVTNPSGICCMVSYMNENLMTGLDYVMLLY